MYDDKRMSVINFLVFTVLVCNNVGYEFAWSYNVGEVKCVKREREALVRFKKGLIDDSGLLSSWGSEDDKKKCCKWEGVGCSNTTGHVTGLFLDGFYLRGYVSSALLELHRLEDLDLSGNDFGRNKIPKFICSMKQLQHLDLKSSNFSGTIPSQIGNLTNLQTLDLSHNDFGNSKIPESIGSMKKLEELYLGSSNFFGTIPSQIGNLTNLQTLDLSENDFGNSKIPEFIGSLKKLEELNLGWCNFYGIVPPQIGNLTNLQTLDLSKNDFGNSKSPEFIGSMKKLEELYLSSSNFVGTIPSQIGNLTNLQTLDLSHNYFRNSKIPESMGSMKNLDLQSNNFKWLTTSIWQLPKLVTLDVSFNSLNDTITEDDLTNLQNLKYLDLSFNMLILRVRPNWTPPFQLNNIYLGGCDVGPHFPLWLRTHSNFKYIDLSLAGLTGEVPKWFWNLSVGLYYLNLSHNHLSGIISDLSGDISVMDVSSNKFSGPIPLFPASAFLIQLSQNMFSGSISSAICAFPSPVLSLIDLSNNQLVGELPNCWENMTSLNILNLANNNFYGEIPRALGSLLGLWTLQLGNNNFSGELPSTLKKCKGLQLIDVGGNMLTGIIPSWIGPAFHKTMAILILSNNRFEGSIPPQICSLTKIKVLDLSRNHLSGNIPPCFNNFTYIAQMNTTISPFWIRTSGFWTGRRTTSTTQYVDSAILSWKGQYLEYRKNLGFLKLIDLSSNGLVGDIPPSFFSLGGLISLNLSRNRLTGIIPTGIGEMKMLEVLDLSSNHLSGAISNGMAQLHFLAVLNFSNNNLSGKIPVGGQLQTFSASSYAGNTAGLCGSPLPLCPGEGSDPSINNKAGDVDDHDAVIMSFPFLKGLLISIILGFIFGFWGVVGSLIVKESWRRAYFDFWDAVGNWLYVTISIFWAKLIRRS